LWRAAPSHAPGDREEESVIKKIKPKFSVGDTVMALDALTSSSGSIIRATKGEQLKVKEFPPLPGFVIVVGRKGQFATLLENVRPFTRREIEKRTGDPEEER